MLTKITKAVLTFFFVMVLFLIGLKLWFDPNRYKDEISAMVFEATGYELTLKGNIEWSLLPKAHFSLQHAELSGEKGDVQFGFDRAILEMDLGALMKNKWHINRAILEGAELSVTHRSTLKSNTSSSHEGHEIKPNIHKAIADAKSNVDSTASISHQHDFRINKVVIDHANFVLKDDIKGERLHLKDIQLAADNIRLNQPWDIRFSMLWYNPIGMPVEVAALLRIELDVHEKQLSIQPFKFELGDDDLYGNAKVMYAGLPRIEVVLSSPALHLEQYLNIGRSAFEVYQLKSAVSLEMQAGEADVISAFDGKFSVTASQAQFRGYDIDAKLTQLKGILDGLSSSDTDWPSLMIQANTLAQFTPSPKAISVLDSLSIAGTLTKGKIHFVSEGVAYDGRLSGKGSIESLNTIDANFAFDLPKLESQYLVSIPFTLTGTVDQPKVSFGQDKISEQLEPLIQSKIKQAFKKVLLPDGDDTSESSSASDSADEASSEPKDIKKVLQREAVNLLKGLF